MATMQDRETFGRARLSFAQEADIDEFVTLLGRFESGEVGPNQMTETKPAMTATTQSSGCRGPKLKASRSAGTVRSTMTMAMALGRIHFRVGLARSRNDWRIDSRHDRFTRMRARFPTNSVRNATERMTLSG